MIEKKKVFPYREKAEAQNFDRKFPAVVYSGGISSPGNNICQSRHSGPVSSTG
jgi:hypothetical protein